MKTTLPVIFLAFATCAGCQTGTALTHQSPDEHTVTISRPQPDALAQANRAANSYCSSIGGRAYLRDNVQTPQQLQLHFRCEAMSD